MKKILSSLVVLGALIIGGYYLYYKGTPEYALKQIQKSLEYKDKMMLMSHLDLISVKNKIVDDYVDLRIDLNSQELESNQRSRLASEIRPKLNTLLNMVFDSFFIKEKKSKGFSRYQYNYQIEDFEKLDCDSRRCSIKLVLVHRIRRTKNETVIKMRKTREAWRIVEIPNIAGQLIKVLKL